MSSLPSASVSHPPFFLPTDTPSTNFQFDDIPDNFHHHTTTSEYYSHSISSKPTSHSTLQQLADDTLDSLVLRKSSRLTHKPSHLNDFI